MSIQSLLGATASFSGVSPAKTTSSSTGGAADFASLLNDAAQKTNAAITTQRSADAQARAQAKERIMEVGIAKYVEEQKEVEKMMKLLKRLMAELNAQPDLKKQVENVVAHFEENPPQNVNEINDYMQHMIDGLPDASSNNIKQRMEVLFQQIRDLMEKSPEELDKMETLLG